MTLTIGMIKSNPIHYRFKPISFSFFTFSWNRRKEKNINHHLRKGDPRIKRRQDDGSPATRDSMSSSSSYQRGAHTCLHMCRSGDKRGQNVTVQPWSERSELGSSNHREHRARSVLSLSLSAHPSCRRVLDTEGARPGCNTRVYAIKSAGVPLLIG